MLKNAYLEKRVFSSTRGVPRGSRGDPGVRLLQKGRLTKIIRGEHMRNRHIKLIQTFGKCNKPLFRRQRKIPAAGVRGRGVARVWSPNLGQ